MPELTLNLKYASELRANGHHTDAVYNAIKYPGIIVGTVRINPQNPLPLMRGCTWSLDDDNGVYETSCGGLWYFDTGDIKDNECKFCPYCGGKIKETQSVMQKWW